MQGPPLFLRSSEKLQSWARQTRWVADLIFPSRDGKDRKHVLYGLKIGPDPLAAKAGEKTALCPSQSPLFQEEGILKRPRASVRSTSIAPRSGCFNGSSALQALSKGAGDRTWKPKHHPLPRTFRPCRHRQHCPPGRGWERESQMGDISRMASCSAGKCSAAVLRSRLETCKDERAKSLQLTALSSP